ncbi:uncharacterized protein CLUP02_08777 [Colletotrichum lupini]|uniref:Uncharacterized protein n=1 Tax=Colletotrichum lupini TaxID=145971 RepID=A0A9Q8SU56_9PEZI|nr:uncharacterized protein CLUP02_08777 [Colletotrichum lupini]UQC83283.1 hypothetical protein CLUP02_08777 [Colletotrichum lupini]
MSRSYSRLAQLQIHTSHKDKEPDTFGPHGSLLLRTVLPPKDTDGQTGKTRDRRQPMPISERETLPSTTRASWQAPALKRCQRSPKVYKTPEPGRTATTTLDQSAHSPDAVIPSKGCATKKTGLTGRRTGRGLPSLVSLAQAASPRPRPRVLDLHHHRFPTLPYHYLDLDLPLLLRQSKTHLHEHATSTTLTTNLAAKGQPTRTSSSAFLLFPLLICGLLPRLPVPLESRHWRPPSHQTSFTRCAHTQRAPQQKHRRRSRVSGRGRHNAIAACLYEYRTLNDDDIYDCDRLVTYTEPSPHQTLSHLTRSASDWYDTSLPSAPAAAQLDLHSTSIPCPSLPLPLSEEVRTRTTTLRGTTVDAPRPNSHRDRPSLLSHTLPAPQLQPFRFTGFSILAGYFTSVPKHYGVLRISLHIARFPSSSEFPGHLFSILCAAKPHDKPTTLTPQAHKQNCAPSFFCPADQDPSSLTPEGPPVTVVSYWVPVTIKLRGAPASRPALARHLLRAYHLPVPKSQSPRPIFPESYGYPTVERNQPCIYTASLSPPMLLERSRPARSPSLPSSIHTRRPDAPHRAARTPFFLAVSHFNHFILRLPHTSHHHTLPLHPFVCHQCHHSLPVPFHPAQFLSSSPNFKARYITLRQLLPHAPTSPPLLPKPVQPPQLFDIALCNILSSPCILPSRTRKSTPTPDNFTASWPIFPHSFPRQSKAPRASACTATPADDKQP